MNFFYSSATMGYGNGRIWHRFFKFPKLPVVTQTLTRYKKIGYPFAIFRFGNTIYNHVAHHNIGIEKWISLKYNKNISDNVVVSLAGTDEEIEEMVWLLDEINIKGIQLSFSCPNVPDLGNKKIPKSKHPIWLKLNHTQDPYQYDLDRIEMITMNSVPCWFGGMSGMGAQPYNWTFIKKFNMEGLNIAGSSFLSWDDIRYLEEVCGCTSIGIGSVILMKQKLVESILID